MLVWNLVEADGARLGAVRKVGGTVQESEQSFILSRSNMILDFTSRKEFAQIPCRTNAYYDHLPLSLIERSRAADSG